MPKEKIDSLMCCCLQVVRLGQVFDRVLCSGHDRDSCFAAACRCKYPKGLPQLFITSMDLVFVVAKKILEREQMVCKESRICFPQRFKWLKEPMKYFGPWLGSHWPAINAR